MRSVKLKRAKAALAGMMGIEPSTPMAEMIDLVESRYRVVLDRKPDDRAGKVSLLIAMEAAKHMLIPRNTDA